MFYERYSTNGNVTRAASLSRIGRPRCNVSIFFINIPTTGAPLLDRCNQRPPAARWGSGIAFGGVPVRFGDIAHKSLLRKYDFTETVYEIFIACRLQESALHLEAR